MNHSVNFRDYIYIASQSLPAMNYKVLSAWIFAALMVLVILLIIWPSSWLAGLSMALLPFLLIAQAIVILRANEQGKEGFGDDQWYDRP